ncbi:AAA family ATPase [Pasteuria penetrans]|uniref:AAA family ATPase n=1 Tax=Pasteuria penetrans TaxID=86005 RepID=UPI000FBD515C|nr:AAA family ATPase [Pasteuria penetrans]
MTVFHSLRLENFQSHEDTTIEFSPGYNVLIGPSDSGKSAILRALRWVLWNIPRGDDFIRMGTQACTVTLTLADGRSIVRLRTPSLNRYLLQQPGQPEKVFEGFGSHVPEEIIACHGMRSFSVDQRECHLQWSGQLDPPFLLVESERFKAKVLGKIGNTQGFDRAMRRARQERLAALQEGKTWTQQWERAEEALLAFSDLPLQEKRLELAREACQRSQGAFQRAQRLHPLHVKWQVIQEQQRIVEHQLARMHHVEAAQRAWRTAQLGWERFSLLRRLHQRLHFVERECRMQETILRRKPHLEAAETQWKEWQRYRARYLLVSRLYGQWTLHFRRKRLESRRVRGLGAIQRVLGQLNVFSEKLVLFRRLQHRLHDVRERQQRGAVFLARCRDTTCALEAKWQELLHHFPECPTCGQSLMQLRKDSKRRG